jgi:crotonobetainyl-CoA:carnitine CoA-transferase CaiB-like acyl-CoA transferase
MIAPIFKTWDRGRDALQDPKARHLEITVNVAGRPMRAFATVRPPCSLDGAADCAARPPAALDQHRATISAALVRRKP